MLTHIHPIDQGDLQTLVRFNLKSKGNLLVFGPSGGGKTEICIAEPKAAGFNIVYVDLTVIEPPDLIGLPFIVDKKFVEYASPKFMPLMESTDAPTVMLFDEADKTNKDIQSPLLEILQNRTINGKPLNIQSCLLTANLPTEGVFSRPISHALTNRCSVYKMELSFDRWRDWAINNSINPLIVGFISRNQQYLHMSPPNHDPTAYCFPSPRAWSQASRDLACVPDATLDFQYMLISGRVGTDAANMFKVWLEHYRHIEPVLNALLENGTRPDDNMDIDKAIVLSISAVSAIMQECRSNRNDNNKIQLMTKNVFRWLKTIGSQFQMVAIKSSVDTELAAKHQLTKQSDFMGVLNGIYEITESR